MVVIVLNSFRLNVKFLRGGGIGYAAVDANMPASRKAGVTYDNRTWFTVGKEIGMILRRE